MSLVKQMFTARAATFTAAVLMAAGAAQAQKIHDVKVEPAQVMVGQKAKLTAEFDIESGAVNCSVRVIWGDGATEFVHLNQASDVPAVLEHAYAQPGSYELIVEPKGDAPFLRCLGKKKSTTLKVVAAAANGAAATVGAPQCPPGWTLKKSSVNKKTGAFTCIAQPKTPLPTDKPTCPGDLSYFENAKKGQFGCKP